MKQTSAECARFSMRRCFEHLDWALGTGARRFTGLGVVISLLVLAGCGGGKGTDGDSSGSAGTASNSVATYTLALASTTNGGITGATSGSTYAAGSKVTLTATPYGAYGVKAWTGDAAACGSASTCTITLSADETVGVTFKTAPVGFGAGVTGGEGGDVVTVSNTSQLQAALCDSIVNGYCKDAKPRIVQISGDLDFRGTAGTTTSQGCVYSNNSCSYNGKQERILNYSTYCSGRTLFDITYDAAASSPLVVGSNKTVIGLGSTAAIRGKGIMLYGNVSNIILRNFALTDINEGIVWAGDGITIDGADKVWIDHNYFARIGRQMIVTGWEASTHVTISNNYFDGTSDYGHYCNGKHYWVMLLNGDKETITIISNKIYNTSGRSPEVGYYASATGYSPGVVHIVDNLYQGNYYMGIGGSPDVLSFIEGNYFEKSDYFFPIWDGAKNLNFAPLDGGMTSANSVCQTILGRNCAANHAENSLSDFQQNSAVASTIGAATGWASGIGSVSPVAYSTLLDHVSATAGPQQNPDL